MFKRSLPLILILLLLINAEDTFSQGRIEEVGKYDFGVAYDIYVEGNMAFVTGNDGVMIFDIKDKNRPRNLSLYKTGGTFGVTVMNNLLFACAFGRGLVIGDISDPANPVDISVCLSGKKTNRVNVRDGKAFVSSPEFGFYVVDISDPAKPEVIGSFNDGKRARAMRIAGKMLYLADPSSGLKLINISNCVEPLYLKTIDDTNGAWDVKISGDLLFLGCHGNGIRIFDISHPMEPRLLFKHVDEGEIYGITGDDEYCIAADLQEGVKIFDVSDRNNIRMIAHNDKYHPHSVCYDGEYIYLGDQDDGLVILKYFLK